MRVQSSSSATPQHSDTASIHTPVIFWYFRKSLMTGTWKERKQIADRLCQLLLLLAAVTLCVCISNTVNWLTLIQFKYFLAIS